MNRSIIISSVLHALLIFITAFSLPFLAKKPLDMALAFKNAVIAGRQSYLSGRIEKNLMGIASSPLKGII